MLSPPPLAPALLPEPSLPRSRLALVTSPDQRRFLLIVRQAELVGFQPPDLVPEPPGFLESPVRGGGAHLLCELFDVAPEVVADEVVPALGLNVHEHAVAARGVGDDVGDAALDRFGRDAVFEIVRVLLVAAAVGF